MKCPYCGHSDSKVTDSRPTEDSLKIRRRRECNKCGGRFTTYEVVELAPLMVIKKDKTRQPFSRDKLLNGLTRAFVKRQVNTAVLENIVEDIEYSYENQFTREVSSAEIGEEVLKRLRYVDPVAYVRFASVYREFADIQSFMEELVALNRQEDDSMNE